MSTTPPEPDDYLFRALKIWHGVGESDEKEFPEDEKKKMADIIAIIEEASQKENEKLKKDFATSKESDKKENEKKLEEQKVSNDKVIEKIKTENTESSTKLNEEISLLKTKLETAEKTIDEISGRENTLKESLETEKSSCEKLKNELEDTKKSLEETKVKYESKLSESEKKVVAEESRIKGEMKKLEEKEKQMKEEEVKWKKMEKNFSEMEKQFKVKEEEFKKLEKEFKVKEDKMNDIINTVKLEKEELTELKDTLNKKLNNEMDVQAKEFMELNQKYIYGVAKKRFSVAKEKRNILLNRYSNILPFNDTLISLPSKKYINASSIDLYGSKYIASQWPLDKGLVNTEEEFWEMAYSYQCNVIVALQHVSPPKHQYYWPKEKGSKKEYGSFTVKHKTTIVNKHFNVLNLIVSKGKKNRSMHLLLFTKWPDHGLPQDTLSMFTLFKTMSALNGGIMVKKQAPAIIHCSAGIGRTGVYIACDLLVKNNWNRHMVREVVASMRKQRFGMVQNFKQYKYVYDFCDKYVDED